MKTNKSYTILTLFIVFAFILGACGGGAKENKEQNAVEESPIPVYNQPQVIEAAAPLGSDAADEDRSNAPSISYGDAGVQVEKEETSAYGVPIVKVSLRMTTQDGETILKGTADVELPL